MLFKIFGLMKRIVYKVRFGRAVSFEGIPSFVSHMQLYIKSGKMKVGKGFSMKPGVYMATINGGNIIIGDNVSLNRNCILVSRDTIQIGNHCAVGPNTVFYDHDHKFGKNGIEDGYKTSPIVIEDNCWIGAGVTILRGTYIGEGSVIGAGCVVKGEIPAHSLVTANREMNISPIRSEKHNEK